MSRGQRRLALLLAAVLWGLACQPAQALVTFRAKNTGINRTATGNETPSEPAACANGDAEVATVITETAATPGAPAGWTVLSSGTQGTFKWLFAYLIRSGAPSMVFTMGAGSTYREIQIICLTGATTITLDSQSSAGGQGNASAHNPDPPATTAVQTTSLAVMMGANWGGPSSPGPIAAPAGYTLRTDGLLASGYDGQMSTKSLAASGSENPGAFTSFTGNGSAFDYYDGFTVTFTDAGGGATATTPRLMLLGVGGAR